MDDGALVVCATPIGNLGDVTSRVLEALGEADVIAAEDTRVTQKLLSRYEIRTPMESFHANNAQTRLPRILERIRSGQRVALVSDAGTPGISDPGAVLVDACLAEGLRVDVLPGPSAIVSALVASGLPTYAFFFGGFLPRKAGPKERALAELKGLDATLVFYESPRRTSATMDVIASVYPGRQAAMVRELTKIHEEVVRGSVESVAAQLRERTLRGEVVLLVGPPVGEETERPPDESIRHLVDVLVDAGESRRDAVDSVARRLGLPKNEVYRVALAPKGEADSL